MQCGARNRKPVSAITDRAKRYRANTPECRPPGPRRCELCGSPRFLVVDHRDGDETNGAPGNLRYLCKGCNTAKGSEMARRGQGRRTRQYNPLPLAGLVDVAQGLDIAEQLSRRKNPGAHSPAEYREALAVLEGLIPGDPVEARRRVHNTPASIRATAIANPGGDFGGFSFSQVAAAFAGGMDDKSARAIVREVRDSGDLPAYQREVWRRRRARYGRSGWPGAGSEVPF